VHHLVLLSGGIDSATAAHLLISRGQTVDLLHIQYGQAAATAELSASQAIASGLNLAAEVVTLDGRTFGDGEIRGRNALLVDIATLVWPERSGVIVLGIHGGTRYADCTPAFVQRMQALLDLETEGAVRLLAPFVDWTKVEIWQQARVLGVPIALTHSCEAASIACGECSSCLDRDWLHASV